MKRIEEFVLAMYIKESLEGFMTVKECAGFVKKHEATVREHLKSGDIIGDYIGSEWRIPKIQFLEKVVEELEQKLGFKFSDDNHVIKLESAIKDIEKITARMAV